MTQLARHFEEHPEVRYGLTTMCIGIGMGGTVVWENPNYEELRAGAARRETPRHDAFPTEIVTACPACGDVDLPGGAGTLALITLDNGRDHTRPSTFGPAGLAALQRRLERRRGPRDAGEIVAVGVTGKPFIFAVGRRPHHGRARTGRATHASASARLGHDVFRRFGELAVPTFAFVNGAALGGGVELAAALHLPDGLVGGRARSPCPSASSGSCRAGAARTCCRTSSAPRRPSR